MSEETQNVNARTPLRTEAVLEEIERLAEGLSKRVGLFSDWTKVFPQIETVVDQFVTESIKGLSGTEKDVIDTIKDQRGRLALSSGITAQIVSICQQILAFGAAGIALTVGFMDKVRQFSVPVQKLLAIVSIFYAELVVVSLLVLVWYMLQARFRYPYLYFDKIGNAWPFFYYALISPVSRWPIQFANQRFGAAVSYARDLVGFTKRVLEQTPKERLRNELQQYFLLLSYQGYVHQFSLRLASLFMYGFLGSLCTVSIMLVLLLRGLL